MKWMKRLAVLTLCFGVLSTILAGCTTTPAKKEPIAITIWHYYNSAQQQSFDALVNEFNETVGAEQGIVVEAHSYGGVNDLTESVLAAVYGKVGAEDVPDVFAAYADTAYEINGAGMVADITQYLTEQEQAEYVSFYLDEGRFESDGGFKIFPIAKSTELLMLNQTAWDAFAAETGASEEALKTWEGITSVAEQYYRWTDAQTPDVPDDGRAFFGRDAFANYIIIGSKQLGTELFSVADGAVTLQVDKEIMRKLWDNFYVPYVNGYFASEQNFRSDDLRSGEIIALVGSSSGARYFPTEVSQADGSSVPIEGKAYPLPNFEGTEPMAVQQGAGMVVTKSTSEREQAAVTFLKWFTQPEQNVRFSMGSSYLPVTYAANDETALRQAIQEMEGEMSPLLQKSLTIGIEMTHTYELYTNRPFENGYEARQVAENSMLDLAVQDRRQVVAWMENGMSREDAVARFDTEEHFDEWFQSFRDALYAAVAG